MTHTRRFILSNNQAVVSDFRSPSRADAAVHCHLPLSREEAFLRRMDQIAAMAQSEMESYYERSARGQFNHRLMALNVICLDGINRCNS